MGLDMYAFSLDRSEAFATPRDVLNYRAPAVGKDLPTGNIILGAIDGFEKELATLLGPNFSHTLSPDVGADFLDSKYVLPGSTLLHRWRKHPNLHGWMQRLWRVARTGKLDKPFNHKQRVPLDTQALDALEHAVKHRQLPPTTGPFFDVSRASEQERDLEFIAAARAELAAGKFVYYTSWW